MNAKSFKLIFILLSFSLLAMLCLQAFWIRNFYLQKRDAFEKSVYTSLIKISEKLQIRNELKIVKQSLVLKEDVFSFSTTDTIMQSNANNQKSIIKVKKIKKFPKNSIVSVTKKEARGDSFIKISINDAIMNGVNLRSDNNGTNFDSLVHKLITEVRTIDASYVEKTNSDTLKNIIKRDLTNRGIFENFEFSLKKIDQKKETVLAQSKNFDQKKSAYRSDLSVNKILNTHNFLFLQFPDLNGMVVKSMKGSLILSFLFSALLIGIFYYTLRLILGQKKVSDIKNDFINNMTHELKTPIATISLAIDGINNQQIKNNEERFNDYTRILKEENKKLNNHVERVLQMALIEKGELPLTKKVINLVALVQDAVSAFQLQIKKQKAQVRFISSLDEVFYMGDELHWRTVFTNLLDNALKYSTEPCEIRIDMVRYKDDIVIRFIDNGIGIGAASQDKLFDKFYRVQGGNLHDVKGFGLGLSYVKSIVEAHGGIIELKSELNKGCEFTIKLKTDGA